MCLCLDLFYSEKGTPELRVRDIEIARRKSRGSLFAFPAVYCVV